MTQGTRQVSPPRSLIVLVLSALYGAGVWILCPILTGKVEPWDSMILFYLLAIALGGLFSLMHPSAVWPAPVGLILGQAAYAIVALPMGSMFPLGLIVMAVMAIPAAVVAIIVRACRPKKPRAGACPTCGYHLRGLNPGATCPECGNASIPAGR